MPTEPKSLVSIIKHNRSKRLAASTIIETNPADLPIVPKLVADKNSTRDVASDNLQINRGILESVYTSVAGVKNNNKNIIQLFPDIELAIQILVSSILSPKKMTDIQINYRFNKNFIVDPAVTTGLLEEMKEYIEENYKLEDKLPDIVRESLFISGACVYGVISEAAVDEVINSDLLPTYSTEEYKTRVENVISRVTEPVNFITPIKTNAPSVISEKAKPKDLVEWLASEHNINVTDNVGILKFSEVKEKISSAIIRRDIRRGGSISQESLDKINYLDVFRNKSNSGYKQVEMIKTRDSTHRSSIGRPMLTKFPTESVVPVFVPGNEKEHVGYFVLLDENYKPISSGLNNSDLSRLDSGLHKTTGVMTPVQKAYQNLIANSTDQVDINGLFDMYKGVLERQLFSTIKSSLYGKAINISEKNDIYFLMFSRALQEQKTSILYIPKDLVVYFAFQYNETGVGKSLLENLAVQSSLRAILLFAKVMAYAKQSIDVTKVNIGLDPNDPDPEKTIEQVQSSVLKLRQNFLPLGINNPVDLVNWIQRAGLQFSYSNNPMIPNVEISFENAGIQHTLPSSDLEEDLRKQSIIALGLPPETIDNSFSPEFARSVVNNNILLSKRVSVYQDKLNKDLTKFVSTIAYNDEDLRGRIKEFVIEKIDAITESLEEEEKQLLTKDRDSFIDYYIDKICDNVYIELPKPEDTDIANLAQEFELYKTNLEIVIDSVVSAELFADDVSGDISAHMDTIKNLYKNHLLRKWMADNNYFPEVLEIANENDEETEALLSSLVNHMTFTMRNSGKLMRLMKDFKEASNKDLERTMNGEESEPTTASSTNDSGSEEENKGNPEDDFGGLGDLPEDLDLEP